MSRVIVDLGWEYTLKTAWSDALAPTSEFIVGLYHDATDDIQPDDDLAAITTRPAGSGYADQTPAAADFAPEYIGSEWQSTTDVVVFDVSDSTRTVDSYFVGANFLAEGDSSASDHLLATGALTDIIDLSAYDTTFEPNNVGVVSE